MRINGFNVVKSIVAFDTSLGCYADDIWVIPLQKDTSQLPEISENGLVNNYHQPYIELAHEDDELPKTPGKKNPWKVKIVRVNEDDECEIYASGEFTSSRAALKSPMVTHALEKAKLYQQASNISLLDYIYQ